MNENVETIDSSQMEILSEFRGVDAEWDSPAYRLGVLGDDFIIASQNSIVNKPQGKVVPENVNERTKAVFEKGIKNDWWSGSIVFELKNFDGVLERLQELYGERPAREIDLNDFDIVNGKDQIGVRKNSVMPNNVGKPIVSTQISNTRLLEMDDLKLNGWDLFLTPETGLILMDEMKRIRPIIESKLNNQNKEIKNYGTAL